MARAFALLTNSTGTPYQKSIKSSGQVFQADGQLVSERELLGKTSMAYGQILLQLGYSDQASGYTIKPTRFIHPIPDWLMYTEKPC